MQAWSMIARGTTLQYVIRVVNSGHASADVTVTDPLPAGVTYVNGSAQSSFGGPVGFDAATRTLSWSGTVPARGIVEIRFAVVVISEVNSLITNVANVRDSLGTSIEVEATTRVVRYRSLLPLFVKNAQEDRG
jgi:uncharacterized repeat protein (TIGR01451 family)